MGEKVSRVDGDISVVHPVCPLPEYRLRPARTDDGDLEMELGREYILEVEPDRYEAWLRAEEGCRRTFQDNLARARFLVHGNKVAGYYFWSLDDGGAGVLCSIHLRSEHRRKGLGHWLMQCCEADLVSAGVRISLLQFRDHNEAARRLYRKMGYRETGRAGGNVQMAKSLGRHATQGI